jgi:phosphotransferase system enzyme I (PtsI)
MADLGLELHGLGVSPGTGAGLVCRLAPPPSLPEQRLSSSDPVVDAAAALQALEQVGAELERRALTAAATAADVLNAEALIARDPTLAESVAARIRDGAGAAWAVDDALREQQELFVSFGGYLAERAADLDDIRARAVAILLGLPMPGVPSPGHPFVLVADDLAPADTAQLDATAVRALVTVRGGPTSHTAILAKALGIPAVVACRGAMDLPDGASVSVDGTTGRVVVIPSEQVAVVQAAADTERLATAAVTGPGRTSDGHGVKLLLNIGSARDLDGTADDEGFEGVGLVRSEFLYLGRTEAPTAQEQEDAYSDVFAAARGAKVVLRTLDAGADKPLPFLGLAQEENPALGLRGVRVARLRPDVLAEQLAAVARAAKAADADAWVMAPMVSTVTEAATFADQVHGLGLPKAGVMVEVPAAALQAERLLDVVDFLSIGTNDLSQYTMATDRMNGDLADLLDPWQPSLLRLIAMCAEAGAAVGKPVSICGESASDPLLALVFVGMGVTSLSMSRASVPAVRALLVRHSLADCRELADRALAARDHMAARDAVLQRATAQ